MVCTNSCLILFSSLMFLSLSQGLGDQTEQSSGRISCPEGTNAYGSYCYYFVQDLVTWTDADLYCQNMHSGHLVSVLSQAESNFVAALIKESSTDDLNVWAGLHDPRMNRRWRWSSGSLVSYKSWAIGSPSTDNPGYCMSLTSDSGFQNWKDEDCESEFSFVCKFKN